VKTVSSIKKKVEKFRWEDLKRSHEGNLQDLQFLYWQIVSHEILGDKKLSQNDLEYFKSMLLKTECTYRGIFYHYFEVGTRLSKRFNGLEFSAISKEKELWDSWKEDSEQECYKIYKDIIGTVKHAHISLNFMDETISDQSNYVNLEAFSEHGSRKYLNITDFLRNHRLYNINVAKHPESPLAKFRYTLKRPLIIKLHKLGKLLMKEVCMIDVLSQCNSQIQTFESKVKGKERSEIIAMRLHNEISAHKKMELSEALDDFFESYPKFVNLTRPQVKYHFVNKYRNTEGEKFNVDTVDKELRRSHFKKN